MDSILSAAAGKGKVPTPAPSTAQAQSKPKPKADPRPKAASVNPSSPATDTGAVTAKAMKILAEEIGVPESDLRDETAFAEMGVDSLLALTISGKFREELSIDIASSMFVDYPTVRELKGFLGENDPGTEKEARPPSSASSTEGTPRTSSPSTEIESVSSATDVEDAPPLESGDSKMVALIRGTIAEETGVAVEEIDGTTNLAALGLDSLMSLTIMGKLRESTGDDLPSDFFANNPTMNAIEEALGVQQKPKQAQQIESNTQREVKEEPSTGSAKTDSQPDNSLIPFPHKHPDATSVLLQGSAETPKALFLFPDGSGSATSYSSLPRLAPRSSLAVYALNSPFLKSPTSFPKSVPTLTSLYLNEVRRRRPHGPYILAGWSAGGVVAYEACLQLYREGETVDRLILIDAPCPMDLGLLPSHLHEWFNEQGILGQDGNSKGTPDWLIPHFDASVRALAAYQPTLAIKSQPEHAIPRTYMIWAKDGVCKYPDDPRPATPEGGAPTGMRWLLENREGERLKYGGWDQVLGEAAVVETGIVEGVNHFTLMTTGVERLGELIGAALL